MPDTSPGTPVADPPDPNVPDVPVTVGDDHPDVDADPVVDPTPAPLPSPAPVDPVPVVATPTVPPSDPTPADDPVVGSLVIQPLTGGRALVYDGVTQSVFDRISNGGVVFMPDPDTVVNLEGTSVTLRRNAA